MPCRRGGVHLLGPFWLLLGVTGTAETRIPVVNDPQLELTLFAAEPEIMTPIGVAIDRRGRIVVVESHTHFPRADYPGPKRDLVKVFEDLNGDGKPETRSSPTCRRLFR